MTWRLAVLPAEVHIRLPRLPHVRLDVTRTEAVDLLNELAVALSQPTATPFRVPWHMRLRDKWALWRWRKKPVFTPEQAQRMLNGRWGGS